MNEQASQLARVSQRISGAIMEFTATHPAFYADQLRQFVAEKVGPVAPGSADRILRDLRRKGSLNYEVISRKESLYRVTSILQPT